MATYRQRAYGGRTGIGARAGLARLVTLAAGIVAAILVIAILLVVLKANPHNGIVSTIHDGGRWLAGPFANLFKVHGDWRYVVNWGLAAIVYLLVGRMISRALLR
jgi:hypothetical protein